MKKIRKNLICIILWMLVLMLSGCKEQSPTDKWVTSGNSGLKPVGEDQEQEEEKEGLGTVYVLKEIRESEKKLVLVKLGDGYREYVFGYTDSTSMTDRYGKRLRLASLIPGEVFEIEVSLDGSTLKKLEESEEVWIFEDVETFKLNTEKEILSVGSSKYHLAPETLVFNGVQQLRTADLSEKDVVTLIGYEKELISVIVRKGHGTLEFTNTDKFEEGYFVLGNVAAAKISGDMKIQVPSGEFLLSVAHKGRGGSTNVVITSGQTTTVDLSEFAVETTKMSTVTFHLKQEGILLTINGEEIDTNEPLQLAYGTYRIIAEMEGYEDWSRLLFVNSDTLAVTIDMDGADSSSGNEDEDDEDDETDSDNEDDEDDSDEDDSDTLVDEMTNSLIEDVLDTIIGGE